MIKEKMTIESLTYTAKIVNGEIEAVRTQESVEHGLRVFDEKGRYALAAGIGQISDEQLEKEAVETLSLGLTYDYELEKETKFSAVKGNSALLNTEFLVNQTEEILTNLKKMTNKFVFSHNAMVFHSKTRLTNSLGLDLSEEATGNMMFVVLKLIGSPDIINGFTGGASYQALDKEAFYHDADFMFTAIQADTIAFQPGRHKVAFIDGFVMSKFNSDINGENYYRKTSLLADKLNTQIFNPQITISDIVEDDDRCQFTPFDHEGIIANRNFMLIENGVFKNVVLDKKNAKKYNAISTGHGFRNFDSNIAIRPRGLHLNPTTKSLIELSFEHEIVLPLMSGGGDFLPNGNFALPVNLAVVLKNGKIIGKLPQITLNGNYLECLNQDFVHAAVNDIPHLKSNSSTVVVSDVNISVM